mgnify:FL=1
MKTIASCVEQIIASKPFIEEALNEQIINYSALAENLQGQISDMLRKDVKTGAIMMALRRYNQPLNTGTSIKLKQMFNNLGDITVRSGLSDFTYSNSKTLINSNKRVLDKIQSKDNICYAFTRGIYESNIVITSSERETVVNEFKNEQQIGLQENLSAITISLPRENSKVVGLYYQIFKKLAWEGVTLYEVISTTNEFTVLVEDKLVDKAFSVIKSLNQ